MQVYSETAAQQINSLVEFLGYTLMLVLALMLVWGIKFGTVITVADRDEQVQPSVGTLVATSLGTPSIFTRPAGPDVEIVDMMDVAWVGR